MTAPSIDVWGTFDVANLGDLLYPLVLERELRDRGHDPPLRLLSPHGGTMPLGDGRTVGRIALAEDSGFGDQASTTGIVLGGGDILRVLPAAAGELIPGASGVYRYESFISELGMLAEGTPVAWNGVGVPSEFDAGVAAAVRLLATRSRYVSVRDEPSRIILEKAGVDREVHVVPDPALIADRLFARDGIEAAIDRLRSRGSYPASGPVIAFHVSFTDRAQEQECARALRALIEARPGLQIALVAIGPCHGDEPRMTSIASAIGPGAYAVVGDLTITDLVAAIASADAFIGSSLHGNVIAARYGVPNAFLTLPSQRPHKLYACSDYLGRDRWNIDAPDRIVEVGGRLLEGDAPIDDRRITQLATRVDRHYDQLAQALFTHTLAARRAVAARVNEIAEYDDRGTGGIFAFDRLRAAELHQLPYRWGVVDGLFAESDQRALFDAYPVEPFATIAGYDGEKGYEYEARSLVAMGGVAPWRPDLLSEPWFRLATDLCSRRYRDALSAITGVDLEGLVMEANLFHYGNGSWLGPHVDLPEKILTHVLYFNPEWNPRHGGCLRVLGSGDEHDVAAEIPPLAGSSVVLVRSDVSWHAVTRVTPACVETRRSVTVTFYPRGAVSTMWPPSAPPSVHRYPPDARRTRTSSG